MSDHEMMQVMMDMGRRANARKFQIKTYIPELENLKSCLYIGASPDRFEGVDLLVRWEYEVIDVLEIWKPYVKELRRMDKDVGIFNKIILGDGTDLEKYIDRTYDLILWWHGPEHIPEDRFNSTMENMEDWADQYIVLLCPWGKYPQGEVDGNIHQAHFNSLYKHQFTGHGYKVRTLRKPDRRGSNILAWKKVG